MNWNVLLIVYLRPIGNDVTVSVVNRRKVVKKASVIRGKMFCQLTNITCMHKCKLIRVIAQIWQP